MRKTTTPFVDEEILRLKNKDKPEAKENIRR